MNATGMPQPTPNEPVIATDVDEQGADDEDVTDTGPAEDDEQVEDAASQDPNLGLHGYTAQVNDEQVARTPAHGAGNADALGKRPMIPPEVVASVSDANTTQQPNNPTHPGHMLQPWMQKSRQLMTTFLAGKR